jgi:quercetin dioxygenase-like cupin family protein
MLGPGDSYFIESNVPHSTHFVEETILIDIFSPPRKELMEKNRGFAPSATQK